MLILPHYDNEGIIYYSSTQVRGILDLDGPDIARVLRILKERGYAKFFRDNCRRTNAHYSADTVYKLQRMEQGAQMSAQKGSRVYYRLFLRELDHYFPDLASSDKEKKPQ
jgi:hypothetical protein